MLRTFGGAAPGVSPNCRRSRQPVSNFPKHHPWGEQSPGRRASSPPQNPWSSCRLGFWV